jgi:hypothetical protein
MLNIKEVSPEIISKEDYEPTKLENLFVNPADNSAVIVSLNNAYMIVSAQD